MPPHLNAPGLDVDKLCENALTSIRLGAEDFERCRKAAAEGGDPARALSAVRNLFAGVLLLFKYRIAISVEKPEDASALIFNPPEILPFSDDEGGLLWKPSGNFKRTTIDVTTIKKRFESFDIDVDWTVIDRLQDCRNHLEHLHPANTLGEVADFVAQLFPILRDFIEHELDETPAELLGDAWRVMLSNHEFLESLRKECEEAWQECAVPASMEEWLAKAQCPECSSSLLSPSVDSRGTGLTTSKNEKSFEFKCCACGYGDLMVPLLMKTLAQEFYFDERDGGEAQLEDCLSCGHSTYLVHQQACVWCEVELDHTECAFCEEPLGQWDQHNDGLCGYHAHLMAKAMDD